MRRSAAIFLVVICVTLTVVIVFQRRSIAELRADNARLAGSTASQGDDGEQDLALLRAEIERLKQQNEELPRLRGEMTRLREATNEMAKLRLEQQRLQQVLKEARPEAAPTVAPVADGTYFARDTLAFAGYSTPEAAFQSAMWAGINGDLRAFAAGLEPGEMRDRALKDLAENEASESARVIKQFSTVTGFRVLKRVSVDDEVVAMQIQVEGEKPDKFPAAFRKIGQEWKLSDPKKYEEFLRNEPRQ